MIRVCSQTPLFSVKEGGVSCINAVAVVEYWSSKKEHRNYLIGAAEKVSGSFGFGFLEASQNPNLRLR